jgi:UDP-N-acetylmuramoylalanine--D-glutamate ligase
VIQIIGGSDKGLPMHALADGIVTHAKAALCIGTLGPSLADAIENAADGRVNVHRSGDLPTAMAQARKLADSGDIVLLSPGCASYDQFVNFEQRGQQFAELARSDV